MSKLKLILSSIVHTPTVVNIPKAGLSLTILGRIFSFLEKIPHFSDLLTLHGMVYYHYFSGDPI